MTPKPQNTTTPKPQNKPAPKPRKVRQMAPPELVGQVCGLTDPFCEHAYGARYPDDSSSRTLPFTVRQREILTSNPSGEKGLLVAPAINFSPFAVSTAVTGTVLTFVSYDAAVVPVLTGTSEFRIVSVGMILRNVAPMLTASGMVSVRSWAQDGNGIASIDGQSYGASKVVDVALTELKDMHIVFEHTSQMPQAFYDPAIVSPTNAVGTWTNPGFNPITIFVNGCPASTAVISVEYVMHVELKFGDSSALLLATVPSPKANSLVTGTASYITSEAKSFFAENGKLYMKYIRDLAVQRILAAMGPKGRVASLGYKALTYAVEVD